MEAFETFLPSSTRISCSLPSSLDFPKAPRPLSSLAGRIHYERARRRRQGHPRAVTDTLQSAKLNTQHRDVTLMRSELDVLLDKMSHPFTASHSKRARTLASPS